MSSRPMKVRQNVVDDAKALFESGDLNVEAQRAIFKRVTGTDCELTDEQVMIASMTEDDDENEFVHACRHIAMYGFEIMSDDEKTA